MKAGAAPGSFLLTLRLHAGAGEYALQAGGHALKHQSSFFKYLPLVRAHVFQLHAYMCNMGTPDTHRDQKRGINALELEL